MTIEEYLERSYWVIDILPKQVPATNILLKLNCYEDIDVSYDGEDWITNPTPHELEATLLKCMADKHLFYVFLKSADVLITVSGDDTYMTVYNPTEEVLELIGSLADSEGLFVWR